MYIIDPVHIEYFDDISTNQKNNVSLKISLVLLESLIYCLNFLTM